MLTRAGARLQAAAERCHAGRNGESGSVVDALWRRHRGPYGAALRVAIVACVLAARPVVADSAPVTDEPPAPATGTPAADPSASGAFGVESPGGSAPATDGPTVDEPEGVIRLSDALALALARSPDLASFSWRIRAAEAQLLQAGLRPNPELGFRAEDLGVSGVFRGVDQAEVTVELSQLVELGGKRTARIDQASTDQELAGWDYEIQRIEVLTRTAQAFVAVLVAQAQLALAEESTRLAEAVIDAVAVRVRAGGTSPVELIKARVALASAEVEREEARHALHLARSQLAAAWGSTEPRFSRADGPLDQVRSVPSLPALKRKLERSPELARWATEILQRRAAIALEEARSVPDVTARGGYKRLFDPDENTFVLGVSIPLPVLNRNQGAILEARTRLAQAREDRRATEVRLVTALTAACESLETAHIEITALRSKILPGAEQAFATLNAGYREGRFSYLEVLDAQRTLIAARRQYVRALGDYHHAVAAVERLLGEPVGGDLGSIPPERN